MQAATDFPQMIGDQFETMLEFSEKQPLVCGVSLHTFVVGQPFRFAQLRKALVQLRNHPRLDRVWITTPARIAEYVAELPAGTLQG